MVVLVAPDGMLPVSQPVLSLVDVCAAPSSFRHVIVVPLAMVMLLGLNAIALITTVFGGILAGGVFEP